MSSYKIPSAEVKKKRAIYTSNLRLNATLSTNTVYAAYVDVYETLRICNITLTSYRIARLRALCSRRRQKEGAIIL